MQPRSHALVLRLGLARAEAPDLEPHLDALQRGSDDEDVYQWPLVGWRTPALGLTHTYRPGHRFGELPLLPSARARVIVICRQAEHRFARDRAGACQLLGHACHLLTDVAVPARTRGVWHYLGDPLETWIEHHLDLLDQLAAVPRPDGATPGELTDRLARQSASHAVDRTRALVGQLLARLGARRPLDERLVEQQARRLFPQAVAHVAALLRAFASATR